MTFVNQGVNAGLAEDHRDIMSFVTLPFLGML